MARRSHEIEEQYDTNMENPTHTPPGPVPPTSRRSFYVGMVILAFLLVAVAYFLVGLLSDEPDSTDPGTNTDVPERVEDENVE